MISPDARPICLERLTLIVRDRLKQPTLAITEETRAADVRGWDSLANIQIILGIEKEFALRLKAAEIARMKNVGHVLDVIIARGTLP